MLVIRLVLTSCSLLTMQRTNQKALKAQPRPFPKGILLKEQKGSMEMEALRQEGKVGIPHQEDCSRPAPLLEGQATGRRVEVRPL